jgi:hypothetical protein
MSSSMKMTCGHVPEKDDTCDNIIIIILKGRDKLGEVGVDQMIILPRVWVTIDGVWVGNWIY